MATVFENVRFASYDGDGKIKEIDDVPYKLDIAEENGTLVVNLCNGKLVDGLVGWRYFVGFMVIEDESQFQVSVQCLIFVLLKTQFLFVHCHFKVCLVSFTFFYYLNP